MSFDAIRASVQETGTDARVEVNQRALIDKILARYASAGAVYRELLQNSNDAEASIAEIHFTVEESIVKQVLYRNNGMPFRPQDWHRLQKIAEGNPDVSKVGAFGVGAYTMFSVCEEPLVISGNSSLCFVWKGDALWCKTAPLSAEAQAKNDAQWTSFVLPSRDPYPLPDLVEFGEFLCASLTFTQCLKHVRVLVNDEDRLSITKTVVQEPRPVATPKSSSWFSSQGAAVTTTPKGTFSLSSGSSSSSYLSSSSSSSDSKNNAIYESIHRISVSMDGSSSSMDARYVSATAKTKIGSEMARRMQRVTKKQPPKQVQLQLFLNASRNTERPRNPAERITQSFSPKQGSGRIFIGFRTSQTTGLAAHVAAPFIPTVEREAMDLQDPTLRIFNLELLELGGILLRLTLEHTMYTQIDSAWKENADERHALEEKLRQEEKDRRKKKKSEQEEQKAAVAQKETEAKAEEPPELETSRSSGLMGFARFMARGVKKQIVSVVNTVEKIMDDGSDLLNPSDPRPLSTEEEDAIVLMQSFCPMQSTPDPLVGTALAQGFSRCLPDKAPPVLTRSGVVGGDEARLPNYGIEEFVKDDVVRSVVFKNCEEYHSVIAGCRKVTLVDLARTVDSKPLEEEEMVTLIKWLTKFKRIDPHGVASLGPTLKEAITYYPANAKSKGENGEKDVLDVVALSGILFYVEKDSLLASPTLPMPETVLSNRLRDEIGLTTLGDPTLAKWFSGLPVEVWADFVSHHTSMTGAKKEDESLRVEVLSILCKEFSRRSIRERDVFGNFCCGLLADRPCVPSDQPAHYERPSDLYLQSAELAAFEGVGSFHKVSDKLNAAGISEDFLVVLGVRKSVAIDFLFANLSTLKWSVDPKPLVEYLRKATLTREDMVKLSSTRYLPAANDETKLFAPSELYLPSPELLAFPFIQMLRWPSEKEVSERSDNGKFLQMIGMKSTPPLSQVLEYLSKADIDLETRIKCLDFLCDRLGPHGAYHSEYSRLGFSRRNTYRFIPCTIMHPFEQETPSSELRSSVTCFSEGSCGVMGFPVIDPKLGENRKMYASLLQCENEPEASLLVHMLVQLISSAKKKQKKSPDATQLIVNTVMGLFKYLSHRASEIDESALRRLQPESFIPCMVNDNLEWFRADQVFFRSTNGNVDTMTEELFPVIDFSPFLAAAGVRQEASTKDMFQLMLDKPQDLLNTLGSEKKYRSLLRRIAANPPFRRVTQEIRKSPFLLAYSVKSTSKGKSEAEEAPTYHLAKAEDIYIIDNSFFGRMFQVDRAPHETDLQDFYVMLGSCYISKSVDRRFEVVGKPDGNSQLTRDLKERLLERSPLLVSPNITARPLVKDAGSVLAETNLKFFEASNLMAVYSLGGKTRRNRTTCFSRHVKGKQHAIYIVNDFDWFDVGYAIGDLILARCQLEDAFFISSLLEAPLEQLSARGFPVDRILQPEPQVVPPPKPPPPAPVPATREAPVPTPPPQPASGGPPSSAAASASTVAASPVDGSAPPSTPTSVPPAPEQPKTKKSTAKEEDMSGLTADGIEEIVFQMFPDADPEFVRSALGKNPSLEDVQALAEQMASGNYPRKKGKASGSSPSPPVAQPPSPPTKKGSRFGRRLGKALGGLRGSSNKLPSPPPGAAAAAAAAAGSGMFAPPPQPGTAAASTKHETARPVTPATDSQSQSGLERMLEQTVQASTHVSRHGVESGPTTVTSKIPEGLDRGETCDVIPGQSLQPYPGSRGDGKTLNGIRVFSSRSESSSSAFLSQNEDTTEQFSLVLARLADVFSLPLSSMAIFHDPTGGTIAFNSNKALHFNLRFFHALHYLQGKQHDPECYSYWYITTAHELAHHLVSAHNKEHGFYTESYASHYLPKLMALLSSLQ